jgi:hypothetical protein
VGEQDPCWNSCVARAFSALVDISFVLLLVAGTFLVVILTAIAKGGI